MTIEQKLKHYLSLAYPIEIVEDDGAIVASIPDLPGCNTYGDNLEEALRSLQETKELWLKGKIDAGQPIPEPSTAEEYSGKFVLRIPRMLHRSLDREAKSQGISLNQYVAYLLAERHVLAQTLKHIEKKPVTATRYSSKTGSKKIGKIMRNR